MQSAHVPFRTLSRKSVLTGLLKQTSALESFLFTVLFLSCFTSKIFPAALICDRILNCKTLPVALLVTVTDKI